VSNRDAIGAVVTVKAGARTLTKVMDGCSGYLSHSLIPLYFGLGDAEKADWAEVVWPSGRRQRVPGPLAGGQPLRLSEGEAGG
jgi:enediyne biosynthesis protein E4